MSMLESAIVAFAVLLDQLSKWWAQTSLSAQSHITLVPGILELRYVENRGAAFSILWGKIGFLIALSAIVIMLLLFYLIRYRQQETVLSRIAIASILGGALSNLIDRIFRGAVIDMFNPLFVQFAVFNVADIFVTCGTILLVFTLVFLPLFKRKKRNDAAI
jgi:signal peptidase II